MSETAILSSFVGGALVQGTGSDVEVIQPADDRRVGIIKEAGAEGVAAAVMSAKAAFDKRPRSQLHERISLLHAAAAVIFQHTNEIADIICDDVGKPLRSAKFEVTRGAEVMKACAEGLTQFRGETIGLDAVPSGAGCFGFVRHVPYGVVAAITPFNAPVNLLVQKVGPAVAAGNAVVVKPSPAGHRTAVRLAELFVEAGWPKGLFNVVGGDRETALALASHPDVRAVSVTGGTAAGEALARAAGAKKFMAELGSNAANIVLQDADLTKAAQKIAGAGFEASGQQCISAQRILVDESIFGPFIEKLVAAAKALKVGPARDPATDLGPMVSRAAAERVMGFFEDARQRGGKVYLAPQRDGAIVSPGILAATPRDARLWREEVFGPLVVVETFRTTDEALALANDSVFGLQGAVFTESLREAFAFIEKFDVGALWINEASRFRLDMYPFGGVKQSGVGREGIRYAIEDMAQLKFIGVRT